MRNLMVLEDYENLTKDFQFFNHYRIKVKNTINILNMNIALLIKDELMELN